MGYFQKTVQSTEIIISLNFINVDIVIIIIISLQQILLMYNV